MLLYYPSVSCGFLEDIRETFQVSQDLAVLMDMHISSCGLVALPICFSSHDGQSFENYKFLMTDRRRHAKAEALKLFKLISQGEVNSVELPTFDPEKVALEEMMKTGVLRYRTRRRNNGRKYSTVVARTVDKTDQLSFFQEISRSTSHQNGAEATSPKSGSPKALLKLFKQGRVFEKHSFSEFVCQSVRLTDDALFNELLEDVRFYKSLTWNRIDAFLNGHLDELFVWPDLDQCAEADLGQIGKAEFQERGLFESLQYRVGAHSSPRSIRRKQLSNYIEAGTVDKSCSEDWKELDSVERLRKLALKIAMHIRMSRGKSDQDFSLALGHWTEDLEWLRERYYEPLKNPFFDWPSFG